MILDKSIIEKELSQPKEEISIIKLVDSLIEYSYNARASDIHIEPAENKFVARLRIDGVMHDTFVFPKEIQAEIISRIKVLSGLRTDEHQMAQDGRFKFVAKDGTCFRQGHLAD
jgi:type II secretory ATPase GspE/PulE/Tfp pilus assembly ATPase PilB-like protein